MTSPTVAPSRPLGSAAAWFAAALALYLATGARGLIWADSSKLTLYALKGYLPSLNPGDHAGWVALAWAWLRLWGGDPVVAAHRLSAFSGAALVALAYLFALRDQRDAGRAHTTAAILMVALPVWWASTVAETYATAMALALAGAVVAQGGSGWRRSVAAGGLWGLALATHALVGFLVVPLAWETLRRRAWRTLPGVAAGLAPVWLAAGGAPLDPLTGFAAGGAFTWEWHLESFVAFARAPQEAVLEVGLLLLGLGPLGVAALVRGRAGGRSCAAWAIGLGGCAVLLLGYAPYRLHLMVGFVLVGLLLATPGRLARSWRAGHVVVQAAIYLVAPALLTAAGHAGLGVRALPFRDNAFYFLCPVKSVAAPAAREAAPLARLRTALDPGAGRYLAAIERCAPDGAVVLADFNPGAVLRLAQAARGWRRDLEVRPVVVDVAQAAVDPGAALAAVARSLSRARPVVLADSYEPYYHLAAFGPGLVAVRCEAGVRLLPRVPPPER